MVNNEVRPPTPCRPAPLPSTPPTPTHKASLHLYGLSLCTLSSVFCQLTPVSLESWDSLVKGKANTLV